MPAFTGAALAQTGTPSKPATTAANTPALSRTDPRFIWDLTRLYPSDAAWDAERLAVAAEIPSLSHLKGTLNTAAGMRTALDRISALTRRNQRLSVFANTQQNAIMDEMEVFAGEEQLKFGAVVSLLKRNGRSRGTA